MQLLAGHAIYQGSKGGGGSAHTPVEEPDDLLSDGKLKMLLAITEGEIEGDLTAQQVLLNDTQLADDNGNYNFTGVKWEYRKGTQDQTYIAGMPEIDNELSVGVEVKQSIPWTRQYSNLQLDAVRIKLSLPVQYQYKDNGDMVGTVTQYAIDVSTDGGSYQTVVNGKFDGKTTSEYQRDHRIDLPKATTGWAIRVRRITADSSDSRLINAFKVFSFAEVIDSKLRYPNTALLYVEVDSSQFNGSAPKVTCKPKGRIIRVPTTYDPVSRTYSGTWQGDFKWAYTNNPAWIFYDLVLDKIFGMGNRVDISMIDKWELYAIAQYCDQMVPDGAGGTEPRFTCNVYIQSQEDAYNVLKDIAAIFRGITFWGNSQIYVNADVPVDDLDFTYSASNVIDGFFSYAGGSYKNRNSSCLVSYSEPGNHYSDTTEGVYDPDLVARYGVQQMQLTAIGCTSQSEAHRRGRWALLSNAADGSVSFSVGLDGHIPLPASVIGVADPRRAGKENGGRIAAVSGRNITLDRAVDFVAGDRLILNLPDGTAQTRTIGAFSADKKTVTVNTAYSQAPVAGLVWVIDSDDLAVQQFRVTSVAANDDGNFTIAAVQHDPNKYRYIDDGVRIDPPPITVTPIDVMKAPENITVQEVDHVAQGLTVASMQVAWNKVEGAIRYVAQWRKDNGDWVNVGTIGTQGFSIQGIYSGIYDVRVRAENAAEVSSPWGYSASTNLSGKVGKPGMPENLIASTNVVWAIDITWAFPAGSGDTAYTEIEVVTTADGQNPLFLAYVPYPGVSYQHGPMPAGIRRWYRARLVDRIGNKGDWTAFVAGMSNINADDYLGDIGDGFLTDEDGERLTGDIETNIEAILQNALANNATVDHQFKQYGEVRADILVVKTTVAEVDRAMADLTTQVQAQIGDVTASLEDKLTAIVDADGATAIHTLKAGVRINGVMYNAGMSIAVLAQAGQPVVTRVGFNANQFVLMSGSGNTQYSPFAVVNGQVFISDAFIQDGTITNTKIGNYIQSNNYSVSAKTGWNLDKGGKLTMFGNGGSTGYVQLDEDGLKVYNGTTLAVVVGKKV
ncbi:TipJ family phage tail tip protein [Winslowiella arboricola]|uniref:host specificity protein J n=1 Tax=Winslowiella arboricola TaxID=2978220 RepID=UPI00225E0364|nr:host specificity protein J [Winslowiella arboricola]MCU5775239.1 host specificity protein J [Winslowiella arboricola]